ncbi:transcriptional regulator SdiA [Enterobacterales bacterium CwR94]|nr:transcriptional regulator SdiA [Enterobacterales bacterium CwR94]
MTPDNYFAWQRALHEAFQQLSTTEQLRELLHKQVLALGFDYYGLMIRHPIPFTRPRIFIFSNTPQAWLDHYHQHNFIDIDPTVSLYRQPGRAELWSDALFQHSRTMWNDIRDFGLRAGFSCSVIAPNRATGIISVARKDVIKAIVLEYGLPERLRYLAELALMTLIRIDDPSMSALNISLTRRELEVLQWTAEGKTAAEISLILGISQHTVNFHQKNMQKRFNAPNKTQIACYAAAVGLIG